MQTKNLTSGPRGGMLAVQWAATDDVRQQRVRKERGFVMENALYAKSGAPVGFHDGKIIYDLLGQAVGQLRGSRVYCMGGHYFGELNNGVILKKSIIRGSIPAHNHAGSRGRGNQGVRNHSSRGIRKNPKQ